MGRTTAAPRKKIAARPAIRGASNAAVAKPTASAIRSAAPERTIRRIRRYLDDGTYIYHHVDYGRYRQLMIEHVTNMCDDMGTLTAAVGNVLGKTGPSQHAAMLGVGDAIDRVHTGCAHGHTPSARERADRSPRGVFCAGITIRSALRRSSRAAPCELRTP